MTTKHEVSTARPPQQGRRRPGTPPVPTQRALPALPHPKGLEGTSNGQGSHTTKDIAVTPGLIQGKKTPRLVLGRQGGLEPAGQGPGKAPTETGSSPEGVCPGLAESQ